MGIHIKRNDRRATGRGDRFKAGSSCACLCVSDLLVVLWRAGIVGRPGAARGNQGRSDDTDAWKWVESREELRVPCTIRPAPGNG